MVAQSFDSVEYPNKLDLWSLPREPGAFEVSRAIHILMSGTLTDDCVSMMRSGQSTLRQWQVVDLAYLANLRMAFLSSIDL